MKAMKGSDGWRVWILAGVISAAGLELAARASEGPTNARPNFLGTFFDSLANWDFAAKNLAADGLNGVLSD